MSDERKAEAGFAGALGSASEPFNEWECLVASQTIYTPDVVRAVNAIVKDHASSEKLIRICSQAVLNPVEAVSLITAIGAGARVSPNDPSSPTPPTATVERTKSVGTTEAVERKEEAAFGAAPLLGYIPYRSLEGIFECQAGIPPYLRQK